ncbi:Glyoxylase, beta-lactamase superfamily II [Ferrithrix thermotolerans DSM 19514]|jgi:glyoxylase-like metal-dependent hydrolase (beta-lactamase superfamily II)|uniref:Glyoxylase, beta-lactamase superfamily II n=1 Tax=Ferrithrix thermotolerans DSM 19514 TaxID=1121881 RepID=A0A1M4V0I0_9ACTN|nr:MBL fold metallo-hydrolase [Ferrithrix thermotolerans]SHE62455.1 Glyoxylase, beta-lactamase superfamily II [Ferrithrix thermotolerans DSM 19514]
MNPKDKALVTEIAPSVYQIDTMLGGWNKVTAGYLIGKREPLLIETGSQSSVPVLLEALKTLNVSSSDLAGVAVTHIHLDHAGGVGDVALAFPNAKVYVHEKGARHLADPQRLVASASMVYGELLDSLYGRMMPTPSERIKVLLDGEKVSVDHEEKIVAIDSPGHAKHHLGFFHEESGLLFSGDAVGVKLPDVGVLWPATPPPDFDLELFLGSLERFRAYKPKGLAFAHYGVVESPDETLSESRDIITRWAEVATAAFRSGASIDDALQIEFDAMLSNVPQKARERAETLSGVHSNAQGLRRWLSKLGDGGARTELS